MNELEKKKQEYSALLEKAQKENRGLDADETKRADILKAEITALELSEKDKQAAIAAAIATHDEQRRSLAAAAAGNQVKPGDLPKNEYYRSLAKGSADVGNKEVIADVVRVYQQMSPIFAAHTNVQTRSTGNTFQFTHITADTTKGYAKTEGQAGRDDTTTVVVMKSVDFKTYSSEKVLITQELLDDAAADISAEVNTSGMAKSVMAFGTAMITALKSAIADPTDTATTSWQISDLIVMFYEIPTRNRYGVKWMCNSKTAAKLVGLLGVEDGPQLTAIGLTAGNILTDEGFADDEVWAGNPTLALAIGQRTPVRVFTQEVSEGRTYELQPRFAVALRDATALAARQRKTA